MVADPKVTVVSTWWGPLPSYLDLTLRTIGGNPDIRWLLFTGAKVSGPPNVEVHRTSFDAFIERLQAYFDFPLGITRPYKVCDFRPAFGELFADELAGCDYWGHADLDMIFGQVMPVLRPAFVDRARKVLVRGCFALYENTPEANAWYQSDAAPDVDYRAAFSNPAPCYFDEWKGIYPILQALGVQVWASDSEVFDINPYRFHPAAYDGAEVRPAYLWDRGNVLEHSAAGYRQALGVHLQKRPMRPPSSDVLHADKFYILGDRFSARRSLLVEDLLPMADFYLKRLRRLI